MKKVLVVFLVFLSFFSSQAQVLKPAKWSFNVSKAEIKTGEEIDLVIHVDINDKWYLYSSDFSQDLGPTVTTFTFIPDASYQLVGKIKAIGASKKYSDVFEGEYTYFKKKAEFRQTVKILKINPVIKGSYESQVCSDIDGKCIQDNGDFLFSGIKVLAENNIKKEDQSQIENTNPTELAIVKTDSLKEKNKEITLSENSKVVVDDKKEESLWGFAILAFLGGLSALITPCVFPMIPMTVTFFTKQSSNRKQGITKATVFGLSIVLIYTIPGTLVAMISGADAANFLSTHWFPNLLFFTIFVVFAMSFLGLFEIILPPSLVNKVDEQADKKGGYIGVFFMAFTLALVSFSCTGPIVGSLLVAAAGGQILKPIIGMFAFSSAIALPYTLFAIFPSWMKSLPKSGGWLNSVKVVLGFLELALALKFLSIVDQVYHWNVLDRDIFLAFWIVIFSLMGFYLIGKLEFPHDSKLEKIPVPRLVLAIFVFTFVVYMIPGLFGSPLSPLAGYLPPESTIDDRNVFQPAGNAVLTNTAKLNEKVTFSDKFKFPHRLEGFFEYKQGLEYAKKVNKPIFIDFTGHGCVNCREMEARVWSKPEVLKRLQNDYVLIALYVDDKTELPENEWVIGKDGRVKRTIGAINGAIQIERFNNNAQPFYCLLNTNGELLITPKAYDLNVENFVNFLDEGLKNFKEGKSVERLTVLK